MSPYTRVYSCKVGNKMCSSMVPQTQVPPSSYWHTQPLLENVHVCLAFRPPAFDSSGSAVSECRKRSARRCALATSTLLSDCQLCSVSSSSAAAASKSSRSSAPPLILYYSSCSADIPVSLLHQRATVDTTVSNSHQCCKLPVLRAEGARAFETLEGSSPHCDTSGKIRAQCPRPHACLLDEANNYREDECRFRKSCERIEWR